jgi:dienelactone hydrolase
VAYAKTLSGVNGSRIGLLGFSLGGHLCLRLRETAKVLVEFFAPQLPELGGLGPSGRLTLDALIHHGDADQLVPFDVNAKTIYNDLRASGATTTLFPYLGAGHGFVGTDFANTDARSKSKERTMTMFETHL